MKVTVFCSQAASDGKNYLATLIADPDPETFAPSKGVRFTLEITQFGDGAVEFIPGHSYVLEFPDKPVA